MTIIPEAPNSFYKCNGALTKQIPKAAPHKAIQTNIGQIFFKAVQIVSLSVLLISSTINASYIRLIANFSSSLVASKSFDSSSFGSSNKSELQIVSIFYFNSLIN